MLHKRLTKSLVSILEEEGIFDGQSDVDEQNLVGATRRIAAEFVEEVSSFSLGLLFSSYLMPRLLTSSWPFLLLNGSVHAG
jgi:hypothetical protein